jgi:hypothetical protein
MDDVIQMKRLNIHTVMSILMSSCDVNHVLIANLSIRRSLNAVKHFCRLIPDDHATPTSRQVPKVAVTHGRLDPSCRMSGEVRVSTHVNRPASVGVHRRGVWLTCGPRATRHQRRRWRSPRASRSRSSDSLNGGSSRYGAGWMRNPGGPTFESYMTGNAGGIPCRLRSS